MVFKPFKPPLIRKPQPQPQPQPSPSNEIGTEPAPRETITITDDQDAPPAKKQRLQTESAPRRPLLQVRNQGGLGGGENGEKEREKKTTGGGNGDRNGSGGERFFNVLWRKPTTKKNKTWDGDGILITRDDGYAYLQDMSGKYMGRVMHGSKLEPGTMLSTGSKEMEVDSEIPRKEYMSGRVFLESDTAPVAPSVPTKQFVPLAGQNKAGTRNAATTGATARSTSAYKTPLLETTVIPQTKSLPTPRHDPKAPGALVMKRPDSAPKGKQMVDVVVDPILVKHLRQHQREGVQFLYECVMGLRSFNGKGAILADDMGLGKTLQTIALLWTLLKQNPIYESQPVVKKALIVCPVTLISNWRQEFRKWLGNERIGVFVLDDNRKRLTDFTMGKAYSVMIVGYEKLRTVQEALTRGAGVDIIIADEGHRLKTLQNKSGQAIQSLNAAKRVILSGTPIQNDLREFFAAVDLVNPGVLGTFKAFVKEFETPIVRSRQPEATWKDIEKGEARGEELRELTSKFMLRRTANILAKYLPPKTEYVLFCNPTHAQANFYKHVLASPVFQSVLGNSESALQLITILKKVCNSPSLLSAQNGKDTPSETITSLLSSIPPKLARLNNSPGMSAKIRVLDQLLHNLRTKTSEKIVLVSNYTSTLDLLAKLLSSLSLPFLRLDGSTPAAKRQSLVEDFNRLPASVCFAFLLSAKAGGTGLNLIGASRLVLFDVDWNPATDVQAMARIHRDGQKRHCRIYRVLLKGSLEEKIWQRQVTKIGLADSVMERKDGVAQFSRDELKDLFRLDEQSLCQTHDLLGCECGGWGVAPPNKDEPEGSSARESPEQNKEEDNDDEDEIPDLPDFPTLLKASEVDMEEQERLIRQRQRTRPSKRKHNPNTDEDEDEDEQTDEPINQKNKMQQSLAAYAHIDPLLMSRSKFAENDIMKAIDDDDVLFPLVQEEDNRVGFIFKKRGALPSSDTIGDGAGDDATKGEAGENSVSTPIIVG